MTMVVRATLDKFLSPAELEVVRKQVAEQVGAMYPAKRIRIEIANGKGLLRRAS